MMNIILMLQISKRGKKSFKKQYLIRKNKLDLKNIKELKIKQKKLMMKLRKKKFHLKTFKERSKTKGLSEAC